MIANHSHTTISLVIIAVWEEVLSRWKEYSPKKKNVIFGIMIILGDIDIFGCINGTVNKAKFTLSFSRLQPHITLAWNLMVQLRRQSVWKVDSSLKIIKSHCLWLHDCRSRYSIFVFLIKNGFEVTISIFPLIDYNFTNFFWNCSTASYFIFYIFAI